MICRHCAEQGKKSSVLDLGSSVTSEPYHPHWDEEGNRHSHNPNYHTMRYRCSNGHEWQVAKRDHCPADGCDWNDHLEAD